MFGKPPSNQPITQYTRSLLLNLDYSSHKSTRRRFERMKNYFGKELEIPSKYSNPKYKITDMKIGQL